MVRPLDAIKAGGPLELKVQGSGSTVQLSDVLVGEVWLGSGQSNMAMTVSGVRDKDAEIAAANYPKIRMCMVARKPAAEPQADAKCDWVVCSPKTVARFSAAAYFFGRELHRKLDVPVGLINSSWGGTPIQAWTDLKAQESVPELASIAEGYKRAVAAYDPEAAKKRYEEASGRVGSVTGQGRGQARGQGRGKGQREREG